MSENQAPGSSIAGEQSGGGRTLTPWQLASYGAPAMPLSMVALPMAVYLPAV